MKEERCVKIWPGGQVSDFTVIHGTVDKDGLEDFRLAVHLKTQQNMFLVHSKVVHKGTKWFGLTEQFYVVAVLVPMHICPYQMDATMLPKRYFPRWVSELPYNWSEDRWT